MGKRDIWGAEISGVIRKFVANCVEELREFLLFRGKKIKKGLFQEPRRLNTNRGGGL